MQHDVSNMSHFSGNFLILTTILNLVNCDFWTLLSQTQVTELVEFSICLWLFECNPLKNYESLGFMVIQIWIFMILRIIRRLVLVFISLNLQLQKLWKGQCNNNLLRYQMGGNFGLMSVFLFKNRCLFWPMNIFRFTFVNSEEKET